MKKLLNTKLKVMKNQKGLTLIELLVVIVILGIIAAIAIPMVMGQQDKADKNTNSQNLSIIQDAVNRYYAINNGNPTDLATLKASTNGGPFLKDVPSLKAFTNCTPATTETGAELGWIYVNGTVSAPSGCTN